jgi:hypothetical protein
MNPYIYNNFKNDMQEAVEKFIMRNLLLLSMLMFPTLIAKSQSQVEFEKFLKLFYQCNYPHTASTDYSKNTSVDTGAQSVDDKNLYNLFIGKHIRSVALNCSIQDFEAYYPYIQFPPTDSVYVLILSPEMRDPSCGQGCLLATYSKYNYQLRDTLWISLDGALSPQYIDEQKVVCGFDIESVLTKDSICVETIESYYLRFNNVPKGQPRSKQIKETKFNTTYKMTTGGKFIKLREKREDDIIDPIASRLKEPVHNVR